MSSKVTIFVLLLVLVGVGVAGGWLLSPTPAPTPPVIVVHAAPSPAEPVVPSVDRLNQALNVPDQLRSAEDRADRSQREADALRQRMEARTKQFDDLCDRLHLAEQQLTAAATQNADLKKQVIVAIDEAERLKSELAKAHVTEQETRRELTKQVTKLTDELIDRNRKIDQLQEQKQAAELRQTQLQARLTSLGY